MAFRAHAAAGLAAVYREFGLTASWQPAAGGAALPCTVIKSTPSEDVSFGGSRARMDATSLEVRTSEIAQVSKGDVVTVQDEDAAGRPLTTVWRVLADPPNDDAGLVWLCEVERIAAGG